jgi:hypothetical protein
MLVVAVVQISLQYNPTKRTSAQAVGSSKLGGRQTGICIYRPSTRVKCSCHGHFALVAPLQTSGCGTDSSRRRCPAGSLAQGTMTTIGSLFVARSVPLQLRVSPRQIPFLIRYSCLQQLSANVGTNPLYQHFPTRCMLATEIPLPLAIWSSSQSVRMFVGSRDLGVR